MGFVDAQVGGGNPRQIDQIGLRMIANTQRALGKVSAQNSDPGQSGIENRHPEIGWRRKLRAVAIHTDIERLGHAGMNRHGLGRNIIPVERSGIHVGLRPSDRASVTAAGKHVRCAAPNERILVGSRVKSQ